MMLDSQKNMEYAFIYFLLLQPMLDVLAYFNIPISIFVRVLAMGVGFIYILLQQNNRGEKKALIYFIILGLFMAIHFIMTPELTYIVKTVFFIEMLIVYLFVIQSFSTKENWQQIIQQSVFLNMTFISVIMLLADLTDTAKRSYGSLAKEGHSGWFFSGNELSIILGMGFCIMILYMVQKRTLVNKLQLLPLIGLVIWAMLAVGTKVSFGSVIIILAVAIPFFIAKKSLLNVTILTVLLAGTIFITPSTPISSNLNLTFGWDITNHQRSNIEKDPEKGMQINERVLSGRKDFLNNIWKQYKKAPTSQKLFGMGMGGNYKQSAKLIEMDFLDWFFGFGVIGFVLLMLPLFYIVFHILIHLRKITIPILFTGVSVCLGLGTALVAGHVLSSPASSIYLAIFIGYLFTLTNTTKFDITKKHV